MEADFDDDSLRQLEEDPDYQGNFDVGVVKAFRKRMAFIRAAKDERDFYKMKSLHFERLKGDRKGQCSMRLNLQWRLIFRIEQRDSGKFVVVVSITDYH